MDRESNQNTPQEKSLDETRFFEHSFEHAYTAVFFLDRANQRIGLLKRDASLGYMPNFYTGVGGKIERAQNEGQYTGAVRELNEELVTERSFIREDIAEFARIIINKKLVIAYFAMDYAYPALPTPAPKIGELEWVPFDQVFTLDIIPSTRYFMEVWAKRGWDTSKPFTVFLTREDTTNTHSVVKDFHTEEGLRTNRSRCAVR